MCKPSPEAVVDSPTYCFPNPPPACCCLPAQVTRWLAPHFLQPPLQWAEDTALWLAAPPTRLAGDAVHGALALADRAVGGWGPRVVTDEAGSVECVRVFAILSSCLLDSLAAWLGASTCFRAWRACSAWVAACSSAVSYVSTLYLPVLCFLLQQLHGHSTPSPASPYVRFLRPQLPMPHRSSTRPTSHCRPPPVPPTDRGRQPRRVLPPHLQRAPLAHRLRGVPVAAHAPRPRNGAARLGGTTAPQPGPPQRVARWRGAVGRAASFGAVCGAVRVGAVGMHAVRS